MLRVFRRWNISDSWRTYGFAALDTRTADPTTLSWLATSHSAPPPGPTTTAHHGTASLTSWTAWISHPAPTRWARRNCSCDFPRPSSPSRTPSRCGSTSSSPKSSPCGGASASAGSSPRPSGTSSRCRRKCGAFWRGRERRHGNAPWRRSVISSRDSSSGMGRWRMRTGSFGCRRGWITWTRWRKGRCQSRCWTRRGPSVRRRCGRRRTCCGNCTWRIGFSSTARAAPRPGRICWMKK